MSRDFYINGEALVLVKGMTGTGIATLSELGLAEDRIQVSPRFYHEDIKVNAWGDVPPDVQWKNAEVFVTMSLVHFDPAILDICVRESMAGADSTGTGGAGLTQRAGLRMGGGVARFATGNHYIGLNIRAPQNGRNWRFRFAYLTNNPISYPLGVERSVVPLTWRAIPYTQDPWGAGVGSQSANLWDNELDT